MHHKIVANIFTSLQIVNKVDEENITQNTKILQKRVETKRYTHIALIDAVIKSKISSEHENTHIKIDVHAQIVGP